MDQVNEAIVNVRQNIGNLGDTGSSSLQSITEDTLSLSQAFGVDLFDVTKAAGALLRNKLAPDAQYALDLITYGLQKIPGAQEDLLDTLTEYSVQFAALGLTGDQALAFIQSAMLGGARNTDLAADALKEFNLRARDTTNQGAQEAIEELGLSASRTSDAIAGGGGGAVAAMSELLTRLREIPDPADRSRLATALLGTQAEDLQAALFAVDPTTFTAGLEGVAGAADELNNTLGDNGAAKIETYKRNLELLIASAAGVDGPFGVAAAATAAYGSDVISAAGSIGPLVGGLALIPGVAPRVTALMTRLGDSFSNSASRINANRGALLKGGAALLIYAGAMEAAGKFAPKAEESALSVGKLQLELSKLSEASADGGAFLGKNFENLGGYLRQIADPGLQDRIGDTTAAVFKVFTLGNAGSFEGSDGRRELIADLKNIDSALTAAVNSGNADEAARQFRLLNDEAVRGGAGVDQLAKHLPQYTEAVAAAGAVNGSTVTQVKDLARGLGTQAELADSATESQDKLNKAMADYSNTLLSLRGDQRAFEAAIDDASASVKENGKTLDITTAKGRANADALDQIASAGIKLAQQTPQGANAQKHFADTMATTRSRLIAAAEKMGSTREQARKLATQILGVPRARNIRITSNIDSQVSKIKGLQAQLNRVAGRSYSYTIKEILLSEDRRDAANSRNLPHRATGGPVDAGRAYIVGERGEEVFVPKEDGNILPNVPGRVAGPRRRPDFHVGVGVEAPHRNAPIRLLLDSGGSQLDRLLIEVLRNSIRGIAGGNVQIALGTGRG
jgi:phage-related minor tail protein